MDTASRKGRPNPREHANPISALFFLWTLPLFREGYKKDLELEDLFDPRQKDRSAKLGDMLERTWLRQEQRLAGTGRGANLRAAIVSTFGKEYALLGFLVLLSDVGCRLLQPQLLGGLLRTLGDVDTRTEAVGYACGMVAVVAVQTVCFNHYLLNAYHMGMRVRAASCSLLYRKALRLSQTALGDTAAGQVVNLLSNDVSRFDLVSTFLHYMWAAPVVAAGSAYLMYREIGWPALVGVAAVFAVVPLQAYTGSLLARFRKRTALRTDERVRFMDEIVSGIRVIKMYAWEKPFTALVRQSRRREIGVVRKTSYCRAFFMTIILSITRVGLFCALITLALTDQPLKPDKVFVVLAYFNVIAHVVCVMFIRGVAEVAEALVSVRRLETFLHHEEWKPAAEKPEKAPDSPPPPQSPSQKVSPLDKALPPPGAPPAIELQRVTAQWDSASSDPTLADIDLSVRPGELLAVVGQVGSGKSSLLHAFLGELPPSAGSVRLRGRVSYAAQEPWVFAATVRQNIVFGRPFDPRRYEAVVRACALQRDFQQFPHGDLTVVGQRGASLSGGQKARINLARAVYNEADVYLLDDPLSAVDTHVGKHLFDDCVKGFLRGKTRVLVTHQLQYLADADRIVLLDDGRVKMTGDFRTLAAMVDYRDLLGAQASDDEEEEETKMAEKDEKKDVGRLLRRISTTRSRAESQKSQKSQKSRDSGGRRDSVAEAAAAAAEMAEMSSKYRVGGKSPYMEYFRAGTNPAALLLLGLLFLSAQAVLSGCDWFVSFWSREEERRDENKQKATPAPSLARHKAYNFTYRVNDGSPWITPFDEDDDDLLPVNTYVFIYTGLVVGLLLLALLRSLGFYTLAMRCSERLHNAMFSAVLRTRVRFFDINPSGRILNRFSKDTGTMDEQLPISMLDSTQIILQVVGSVAVSATVSPFFLIPIAVLAVIFYFDRVIYLRTSQNIKRLEGIAKSPVFNHLHATLQGLTTVRAYGAQDILMAEFDKHQDLHSAAWYMFITSANAFGFSLDSMVFIYITLITFFLVFYEDLGGNAGLAITQAMSLTGVLQWGVRQSAEVANNIMSVERVLEYTCLEEEPSLEHPPAPPAPKGWPSKGELVFDKLSLAYSARDPPVLNELTIHVKAGEKVGIVGRTGAGKSSLLAALFRLAWRIDGRLLIDGVDTADVNLQELRARISVIPQDPVLFSGTLRRNLDPFGEYPDDALFRAVEEVELKEALEHGLDSRVAESGSNFSVGQRQLVCLARALVRDNRVLVLDEATANVDPQTDALIQRTIRTKFKHCTVLTVAHRLNTIMDSDKVLVMAAGRMLEFDHPHVLLQNPKGAFTSLVQETGRAMAEQLGRVAEECYNERNDIKSHL